MRGLTIDLIPHVSYMKFEILAFCRSLEFASVKKKMKFSYFWNNTKEFKKKIDVDPPPHHTVFPYKVWNLGRL